MMKKLFIFFVCGLITANSFSQDVNFSQFYKLPLLRNPALSGIFKGDIRVTSAFRSQWGAVGVPFKTVALGTEVKFGVGESNDYVGLGLQVTNDVAGDSRLGRTQVFPVVAYHKSINSDRDTYVSLGFIGGAVQQRFDPSKLRFDDQFVGGAYSPTNPTRQTFNNSNHTYLDAGVGAAFSTQMGYDSRFYVGASYYHLSQPKVAFDPTYDIRMNRKLMLNAGFSTATSDYDRVIFYADFFVQGGSAQGQGGFLFKHDLIQDFEDEAVSISLGSFYRWNDAVIPVIELDYYNFNVGITYDVNVSKLKTASQGRGGFELSVTYKDFLNIRNSSAQKVRCPSFY